MDGIFETTPMDGGVYIAFDGDGGKFWNLYFVSPSGTTLSPGFYPGATRGPVQATAAPGLAVGGEGRGCNTLTGEFTVLEAEFGPGGEVIRFAVDYEQHCEGQAAALFGSVRINSSVPVNGKDLGFYTVTPCRLLDTRATGPALAANATRSVSTASRHGFNSRIGGVLLLPLGASTRPPARSSECLRAIWSLRPFSQLMAVTVGTSNMVARVA